MNRIHESNCATERFGNSIRQRSSAASVQSSPAESLLFSITRKIMKAVRFGRSAMKRTILSLMLAVFSSVLMLTAQEKTGNHEKLGKDHFPVSLSPAAQHQFDRACVMLHSLWVTPT